VAKEGIMNSLKLTTTVAQIGLVAKDQKAVNNVKVALEAFMVLKSIQPKDICDATDYYNFRDKKQFIKNCKKLSESNNEKLEYLFKAIVRSKILDIDDIFGFDVSYDKILTEYQKFDKSYGKIYKVYNRAFSYLNTKSGKVDEKLLEKEVNKYVGFKISSVTPSLINNGNDSYNLNIDACVEIDSDIVIENVNLYMQLIDEQDNLQNFKFYDNSNKTLLGKKPYCATLNNVILEGRNSYITGSSVSPFLIDAKMVYTIKNSLDENTHERVDRILNAGRVVKGDKSSVDIVSQYNDSKFKLYAYNINDIRYNSSTNYKYNWTFETLGCSKVEKNGVEVEYKPCKNRITNATLNVYDKMTNELVVSASKSLQPMTTTIPEGKKDISVLVPSNISMKNAEEKYISFTVINGDKNIDVTCESTENLGVKEVTNNGLKLLAKNSSSDIVNDSIVLNIKSNHKNIQKEINVQILPSDKPIINKEYINYKYSWEENPTDIKPDTVVTQKWGLLNDSDHTIKGVYLLFNPQKSSSGLIHDKKIVLGDIAPFEENKNQKLMITVPKSAAGGKYFGYFDVYYTKDDGAIDRLYYRNGDQASVIYEFKVKEEAVTAPTIENVNIYAVDNKIYGSFDVKQDGNKKIKNLRVYFSPDTYMREDLRYVDIGGSYDSLQDVGEKKFIFDASGYAVKKVYWQIKCINEDGLQAKYTPSGIVEILGEVKKPIIPQNLKASQTTEGVLLSWDAVKGAKTYIPLASLDYTENGNYADITSGCDFKTKTSCLIDSRYFTKQKNWYFAIKVSSNPMSKPVKFEWKDKVVENKYEKYLKDKTLYQIKENNVVDWYFNNNLSEVHIYDVNRESVIQTKLQNNGLSIVDTDSKIDYFIIKSINSDHLILENVDITDSGMILSHNYKAKLYFNKKDAQNVIDDGRGDGEDGGETPIQSLDKVNLHQLSPSTSADYVVLSWSSVSSSANDRPIYEIEIANNSQFTNSKIINAGSNLSFKIENLEYDKKYFFRVRAKNSASVGDWSEMTWTTLYTTHKPKFDLSFQRPVNMGSVDVDNPRFAWKVTDEDDDDLEYYVKIGESSDNLSFNSGWIESDRISWSDITTKALKPNSTYYWKVLVREDGRDKSYYGGEYISSPIWSFTTATKGYDLSIESIKLLDEIKPNSDVRVSVTIKNVGNKTIDEFYAQLKFKKGNKIEEFATKPMRLFENSLSPSASTTIELIADFRDEIVTKNGKEYDNVIEEGVKSALIVELPYTYDEDLNPQNNKKELAFTYISKNKPQFKYFAVGPKSLYDEHKLYTTIGKVVGRLSGIAFDVEDDIKVTKVTIEYQLLDGDKWTLLKTYTNNDDSIDDDYKWIIPEDDSFVTDQMRIRVRAYENKNSFSEKVSYPFSVYDNNLYLEVDDIPTHKIGDEFDINLQVNASSSSKIRLVEIKLISNGYSKVLFTKVDNNGFELLTPIKIKIPDDNKYTSKSAKIKVRVDDTHGNEKIVEKSFVLDANIHVDEIFSDVIDIYNEQYREFPANSSNQRTENDVYKVILDDNNITHILVRSIAWWKNSGSNEMSRDFRYYYITYDYNNKTKSTPKLIYRVKQIDSGSLPSEMVQDFIVTDNNQPYVVTYDGAKKEIFLYSSNGKLSQTYKALDSENIDSINLINYNGNIFLKYRSRLNGVKRVKIANTISDSQSHILVDGYYGSQLRIHGNKLYFPSYAIAFEIDEQLNILGNDLNLGKQDVSLYGNIDSYSNTAFDLLYQENKLIFLMPDGATYNLIDINDDDTLSHYGYLSKVKASIYDDSIIYVYSSKSDLNSNFDAYEIKYLSLDGDIWAEINLGQKIEKDYLPYHVTINKNKLIVAANIDKGSAYIVFGDFSQY
jgi:hypothetical protein